MSLFGRVKTFIKRDVLRDKFLLEVKRWFCDRGDETLRLTYPLDKNSIVWDVGGFTVTSPPPSMRSMEQLFMYLNP